MDRIKISCIVMLICLWISTDVWAQEVIHVEVAGTLPVLIGDKKETVEELTLTGKLNGTDIKCIREMKKLRTLDMNGTEILKSDIVYYVEPYTANGEHVIKTDDEIGDYMFYQLSTLENIILPDKAYKIGTYALGECEKLKSVTIPDGVTEIGTLSFSDCSQLEAIEIPEGCVAILDNAFSGCANLVYVSVPSTVTQMEDYVFDGCANMGSIVWNSELEIKSSFFADVQPCNCLLYVSQGTVLPETWNDNIVRENVAEQVVFNAGYSCYVARELKAKHITYTREFTLPTKKGTAAGWTSVVLPFTVQEFTHESKGKLSPFGATEIGSKPFWLRELASHGFKNVAALEANKPYIIAMPNNSDEYEEQYNISGCVQFEAADEAGVMIPATPSVMPTGENALYELVPTLRSVSKTNRVYALSQEEHGDFPAGSLFVSCLRDIDPFEAYVVTKESATNAPLYYSIGGEGGEITGLEEILKKEDESLKIYTAGNVLYIDSDRDRSISIYDVTGRIVRIVEVHEGSNTVTGLSSGFYFLEGKKVAIK